MVRKKITVEDENQRIDNETFLENLKFVPKTVIRWFVNNVIQRTLSHIVGQGLTKSHVLKCTENGILKTAPTGSGYSTNDTKTGNALNAYGSPITFDSSAATVDIFVFDNPMFFKRSTDGVLFNDEIEIPANSVFSYDASSLQIDTRNKTSGQIARFSIVGWY